MHSHVVVNFLFIFLAVMQSLCEVQWTPSLLQPVITDLITLVDVPTYFNLAYGLWFAIHAGDDLVNKVLGSPFDVKTTPTTKLPPRGQTHNEYISANGVTIPKNGLPLLTRLPGLELADLAVWSPPSLEDVARSTGRVLAT